MKLHRALLPIPLALLAFLACKKAEYQAPAWNVGDWAEYEISGSSLGAYTLRYAITGQEDVMGENYYWLEMVGKSGDNRFVYKMLVPYGYRGVAERMIIKVGDQPALEMPKIEGLNEEPPGENRPYVFLPDEVGAGATGDETIEVPAGEFFCVHAKVKDLRDREVEVWVTKDVPVLGIVQLVSTAENMKLAATGTGAGTAITEEPQQIDPAIFE